MKKWQFMRDIETIRSTIKIPLWNEMFQETRDLSKYWIDNFNESTDFIAGWAHDYVCLNCSAQLEYKRESPLHHICPKCNSLAENTKEILEAWQYYRRTDISMSIEAAAITAVIDDDKNAYDFVISSIGWYADHYNEFTLHGCHAGKGKVMSQSLCEAVWCCRLLNALFIIDFDGQSEIGEKFYSLLFRPLTQLVLSQSNAIHNIPLWHAAEATGAAILFKDEALLKEALFSDFGGYLQIIKGFTEDGMWYENSTTYHYYALEAATNLYRYLHAGSSEVSEIPERILRAWTVFSKIAFEDGSLIATNDGWNNQTLSDKARDSITAAWLLQSNPDVNTLWDVILKFYDKTPCIQALLYGIETSLNPKVKMGSIILPHNKMCLIRTESGNPFVFCKYGNISLSHSHPDALSVSIHPFSIDTGTPGYSAQLHREWYTKTLSHSTVVIDTANQNPCACGTASLSEDGRLFQADVSDAYEGVKISRTLYLTNNTLTDTVTVVSDQIHMIDWIFHAAGESRFSGVLTPADLPDKNNGYSWLKSVHSWTGEILKAEWKINNKTLILTVDPSQLSGAQIFIVKSPDNPGNLYRDTIIIRKSAKQFMVPATFEIANI